MNADSFNRVTDTRFGQILINMEISFHYYCPQEPCYGLYCPPNPPRPNGGFPQNPMFVPRCNEQSEPRYGPPRPFYRPRMPNLEHRPRNAVCPNFHSMPGYFPPPQGNFRQPSNNCFPNRGFPQRSTYFPLVRPHFQPHNPNGMLNAPRYWRNNVPRAPIYQPLCRGARIYPPSFPGASIYPRPFCDGPSPLHRMSPPSFWPRQRLPYRFKEFREPMSVPSRFEERSPRGIENVKLEPLPEIPEEYEINDTFDQNDQLQRQNGQLPLYLRKT